MEVFIRLIYSRREDVPLPMQSKDSIKEIVEKLSWQPDAFWSKGQRTLGDVGAVHKQDGFRYEVHYEDCDTFDLPVKLLGKAVEHQAEIDQLLGMHEVELGIAIYSNGQVNPGFALDNRDLQQLVKLGASVDIDIYMN
jgi:hypothetical protein